MAALALVIRPYWRFQCVQSYGKRYFYSSRKIQHIANEILKSKEEKKDVLSFQQFKEKHLQSFEDFTEQEKTAIIARYSTDWTMREFKRIAVSDSEEMNKANFSLNAKSWDEVINTTNFSSAYENYCELKYSAYLTRSQGGNPATLI